MSEQQDRQERECQNDFAGCRFNDRTIVFVIEPHPESTLERGLAMPVSHQPTPHARMAGRTFEIIWRPDW